MRRKQNRSTDDRCRCSLVCGFCVWWGLCLELFSSSCVCIRVLEFLQFLHRLLNKKSFFHRHCLELDRLQRKTKYKMSFRTNLFFNPRERSSRKDTRDALKKIQHPAYATKQRKTLAFRCIQMSRLTCVK